MGHTKGHKAGKPQLNCQALENPGGKRESTAVTVNSCPPRILATCSTVTELSWHGGTHSFPLTLPPGWTAQGMQQNHPGTGCRV